VTFFIRTSRSAGKQHGDKPSSPVEALLGITRKAPVSIRKFFLRLDTGEKHFSKKRARPQTAPRIFRGTSRVRFRDANFQPGWRRMIRLERLVKHYGSTHAVDDVCATLVDEKTTILIGPSGCGKSTLLSLIVGIETADNGAVYVDDEELTPATAARLRRKMGYVVQDGGLFPHLSARANVELMARECGWDQARRGERIRELCDISRFPGESLDKFPDELSGGQRQRVSLMRALMLDPKILLMDEPLGALDPMIRAELQDELKGIFQNLSKTVVMVTHDIAEAAFFADWIILLAEGRIVQQGSFEQLRKHPATPFVARFLEAQISRLASISAITQTEPERCP
jgi:osmoprotectant transport system ATP-binding protein